ncbi:MAG: hypothetical protein ThorAB25_25910 [Candidatus Thorarchaeota archaeon AB_25]|nr:MAG: hypothetical protein ThorAB25_25910 [Candidatus Thorarchaeota archaeon AB_25]
MIVTIAVAEIYCAVQIYKNRKDFLPSLYILTFIIVLADFVFLLFMFMPSMYIDSMAIAIQFGFMIGLSVIEVGTFARPN